MSQKVERTVIRYSNSFKLMVVQEIEEGHAIEAIRRKYGIGGGATIQIWIKKYGRNHLLNKVVRVETMNERDRIKELEEENRKLKIKLAETFLAKDCLEELVKIANEEYRTDLKKNFGTRSPNDLKKDTE
ncbi:transposase [Aridibaculum aurantiacum]|uniref:transposase n=1 Tax=Aridibaculum aurantiacum TaxID=2810307 RepID=UPI001A96C8FD|nr:transposase [Aridibaculum aurantiacum]